MEFRTGLEDKPWWAAALLGLIVAGAIYFAGNHYLLKPRQENLAQLDAKLVTLQAKIQEGRAAKAQLPQFRQEVQRLELELDKLLRVLPARRNTPELLRRRRGRYTRNVLGLYSSTHSKSASSGLGITSLMRMRAPGMGSAAGVEVSRETCLACDRCDGETESSRLNSTATPSMR